MLKVLDQAKNVDARIQTRFRDFGGQSVFAALTSFFVTALSVNLVVFSMERMLCADSREACLDEISEWLNKLVTITYDQNDKSMVSYILVGTRKDRVSTVQEFEVINQCLHDRFVTNPAWTHRVTNTRGRGGRGRTNLNFFAVDNTLGRGDETVQHLLSTIEELINAKLAHVQVKLTWLKLLDTLLGESKPIFDMPTVVLLAEGCGVEEVEVPDFLIFMHKLSYLMWIDSHRLRDFVIIDPVAVLLQPATNVICKHVPEADDSTVHCTPWQHQCSQELPEDFMDI